MDEPEKTSLVRPCSPIAIFCMLAALAILTYLPTIQRPLLEDDYPNILQAQKYGPVAGWHSMFQDPVFRVRATSWVFMALLYHLFGSHAAGYYTALLLLHVLNVWLIYSLGAWRALGYRRTAWAAAFFAVYEGHQEAVMWVSACPELLMAAFGLASFVLWVRFAQGASVTLYAGSLLAFFLALISKESAVIMVALLALPLALDRKLWRYSVYLLPYAALAILSALSIEHTRAYSFRFQDGSFSLAAPFWRIWPENIARLLWFWGLFSMATLLIWKPPGLPRMLVIAFAWIGFGLLPYSFLTYSMRIPSRQLYLASVGLAILVGFALLELWTRYAQLRPAMAVAVCLIVAGENAGYIWTKKRAQFLERAAPTEQLIALARRTPGPLYIQCFPRPPIVAESALQFAMGRPATDLVWTPDAAIARHASATFCYARR